MAGIIAQATSPPRDAAGTSSDFVIDRAAKMDRSMAISAAAQASAAIQNIASASG
jgi:hypothetical protein